MATKKRKTTTRRAASRKKRAEQRLPAGLGTLFAGLLLVVLAFVFVGAGCTVLGNLLGKWVSRQAEAHFWKNTFHHPPE